VFTFTNSYLKFLKSIKGAKYITLKKIEILLTPNFLTVACIMFEIFKILFLRFFKIL